MDPNVAKLTAKSFNAEAYAAFADAWEKRGGNLAETSLDLELPVELAAQRAYVFRFVPAGDMRVAPYIGPLAAAFGEEVPPEARLEAARPEAPRTRAEVAREASEVFKAAEKEFSGRDERETFAVCRALSQKLDAWAEKGQAGGAHMFAQVARELENVGVKLVATQKNVELGQRAVLMTRDAVAAAAPERTREKDLARD